MERDDLDRRDRANSSATASTSRAVREQCDIHEQRQGLPDAKRASKNAGASVTRNQRRSVFPGPMGEGGGGGRCAGARTRGIMRRPVPFFPSKRRPDNRELNIQAAGEDGAAPTAEKNWLIHVAVDRVCLQHRYSPAGDKLSPGLKKNPPLPPPTGSRASRPRSISACPVETARRGVSVEFLSTFCRGLSRNSDGERKLDQVARKLPRIKFNGGGWLRVCGHRTRVGGKVQCTM